LEIFSPPASLESTENTELNYVLSWIDQASLKLRPGKDTANSKTLSRFAVVAKFFVLSLKINKIGIVAAQEKL